jgi:arsenate reductase
MNIQIFGSKKNADTRKAQRFFKERGIKFQFIDAKQKGLSKGELTSVINAVGGLDRLIDDQARDQKTLTLLKYLVEEQKFAKVLDQQQVLKQPIVRNGKKAAAGYAPDVWQAWIAEEQ